MDDGRLVADDTPAALKARIAGDVILLGFDAPADADRAAAVVRDALGPRDLVVTDRTLHVTVDEGAVSVAPALRALDGAGLHPASVSVDRPSLDDVFLTLTGRTLREDAPDPAPVA